VKATDYASTRLLDQQPTGPHVPPAQREEALLDALRGVPLGAYDRHMIVWAARLWDDPTMRTFVGLLLRARVAGVMDARRGGLPDGSGLPGFDEICTLALRSLEDAADWLRTDWSPLTDAQSESRSAAFKHIQMAKAVLHRAGGGQ
jgi:hypothetical protein